RLPPVSLRRPHLDAIARVDALHRSVGDQAGHGVVDRLAQLVVRAAHADGDVPRHVRLALEWMDEPHLLLGMGHVVVARRGRRHRGGGDLALDQHRQQLVLEQARHELRARLTDFHRGDRAGEDADLAVSAGEVVERAYAVVVGAQRDRHFAVAIGLRYAQSRDYLRIAVGDAVHDDVAVGAEDVVARDHPILAERDAKATRQHPCELHLEAMPLAVLAREGQGVGMRAEAERAGILDGGEAPRARRSRGEGDGTNRGERDDASDHANAPSAAGASGASSTLVLLEAADVMNDSLDLLVVESVPEGRHAALLAVLDAGGDEGIAALRAREHGTLAGGTAAILMA